MSYSIVFNHNFSGDANTSAGAAGTTTGAGQGIVDFAGNALSVAGGELKLAYAGVDPYHNYAVLPGTGTSTSETIEALWPANRPANSTLKLCLRLSPNATPNPSFYRAYLFAAAVVPDTGGATFTVKTVNADNSQTTVLTLSFPGYSDSTAYILQFNVTGSGPTTLTASVLDAGTRAALSTATGTDATPGLQAAGPAALGSDNYHGSYADAATYTLLSSVTVSDQAAPPAIADLPTVTSTATANTVTSNAAGGTLPYARQWHRKLNSVDWTPSSSTLIGGATGATYVDSAVGLADAWCYRCVTTDSSGTPQTAVSQAVVACPPAAAPTGPMRPLPNGLVLVGVGDSWEADGTALAEHAARIASAYGVTVYPVDAGVAGTTATVDWVPGTDPKGVVAAAVGKIAAARAAHPGAAVLASVMLGINDAANGNATAAQTVAAVVALAQYLLAHGADAVELRAPPYQAGVPNVAADEVIAGIRPLLLAAVNPAAGSYAGDVALPAYSSQHPELYVDALHFNTAAWTTYGDMRAAGTRAGYLVSPVALTLTLPGGATSAVVNTPVVATLAVSGATFTGQPTTSTGTVGGGLPAGAASGTVTLTPPGSPGTVTVSVPTTGGTLTATVTVVAGTLTVAPSSVPTGSYQTVTLRGTGLSGLPAYGGTSGAAAQAGPVYTGSDGHQSYTVTVFGTATGTLTIADAGGQSVTVTLACPAPLAPTATAASGKVTLTWPAVPGAASYNVTTVPGGTASVGTNQYAAGNLSNGTTYTFTVAAVDAAGDVSPPSTPAVTAKPFVPTVPGGQAVGVTPSDTADLPFVAQRLHCDAGTVQVQPAGGGSPVKFVMAAGEELILPVTRVYATNTSSGSITALS